MAQDSDNIVPDGFDLEERLKQPTTTPPEEDEKCPYCGSRKLHHRNNDPRGRGPRKEEGNVRCGNCNEHFDDSETV